MYILFIVSSEFSTSTIDDRRKGEILLNETLTEEGMFLPTGIAPKLTCRRR